MGVAAPDPTGHSLVGLAGASKWLVNGVVAVVALLIAGGLYSARRPKGS